MTIRSRRLGPTGRTIIVCAESETGITFGEAVDAADQALLRAKREGRDRIVVAGSEPADDLPPTVAPSEPASTGPIPAAP